MVCIDTDVLIDFLRKDEDTVKKIKNMEDKNMDITTTSINSFELLKGALRSTQKDSKEGTYKLLRNIKILQFGFESSEEAAAIFEDLRTTGRPLDPLDIMIASVVIANGETLLTRNIKHFERINNLKLEEI